MTFDIMMVAIWGLSAIANFWVWRSSPRIPLDKFNFMLGLLSTGFVVYHTYNLIRMVMVS